MDVDADCSQVHFSNKVFGRSIDVDVVDGAAIIPDILLQTDKDLNAWAFVGTAENGYTKISKTFKVNRRNKPADYVFTPPDQITLQTIQSQIGDLADLTTEAKNNLVAAINEAAQSGGGGGSTVELDTTLTQSGKAADAKAVGDALENCVMAEKIDQEGGQGEFIPLLSADGTEYRFYIGNDGIPAVMDVNGRVVWTGTSGGSGGSGGDTGESWVNGKTVHITESVLIQNEYVNSTNGTFIASDGWSRTPYINCAGAKQIRFNLDTGFGHRSDGYNGFYDISKTFIKSFKNKLPYRENTGPNYPTYVDVPDGACYFALSWPHEDIIRLSYTLYDTVQEVTG